MVRKLGRIALVLAVMATGMVVFVAPAQAAAPVVVDISCEPLSRLRVLCLSTVSGGTAPYTYNWFYNDRYFPTQDNKTVTSWSCQAGAPNNYTLAIIDANFQIAFDTTGSDCNSGNP